MSEADFPLELQVFYAVVRGSLGILLATASFGWIKFRKLNPAIRYIVFYLTAVAIIECYAKYLLFNGQHNTFLLAPYTAIELVFLSLFYFHKDKNLNKTKVGALITIGGVYLISPLFLGQNVQLMTWNKLAVNLLFIFLAVRWMINYISSSEQKNSIAARNVNIAIFIYFSTSLLIFYALPFTIGEFILQNIILWIINIIMATLFYCICFHAFVINSRENG